MHQYGNVRLYSTAQPLNTTATSRFDGMDRATLLSSIQDLQLKKEILLQELEVVDLDLRAKQAQYSRLVNDDAVAYRLPNELLTRIFTMCTTNAARTWPSSRSCPTLLPSQVIVSHISHRWRQIALATPLLWNTINFNIRRMNHVQGRILSQLEAHIQRSDTCFLDITLDFQIADNLGSYCQLLAKHSQKWRRLSIVTRFEQLDDIREMLCDADVPILEHLSLSLGKPQSGSLSPRKQFSSVTPAILSSVGRLSFLRLAGQALGNLHPPMSSVTTLHLDGWTRHYMTHEQFKIILEGTPSLINLSFNQLCLHHSRDPFLFVQPTTLHHLRCLRIHGSCSPLSRLISLLNMPRLESISLEGIDTFDSHIMPSVRYLNLDDCSFNEQEVGKLIRSFPLLSDLSIDESMPDVFYMLLPEASEDEMSRPWPQLKTITIRDLQSVDVPYFCNMVFNRHSAAEPGSSPLKNILLDRRSRNVLRAKHRLEWLQDKVLVENADIPASWPLGLEYEDVHDLLE